MSKIWGILDLRLWYRILVPGDKYFYETYTGEFKGDMFHGEGKYCFADGAVYEGHFAHNLRNGSGKLTLPGKI